MDMPRHEPTPSGLTLTALLILLPLLAGLVIAFINTNQQALASNEAPFVTPAAELAIGRCPIELTDNPDTPRHLRYFAACQAKTFDPEPIRWVRPAALTDHCLDRSGPPSAPLETSPEASPKEPIVRGWAPAHLMSGHCAPPDQFLLDTSLGVPAFFFPPKTPLSDLQDSISTRHFQSELKALTIEELITARRRENERRLEFLRNLDADRPRPIEAPLWLLSSKMEQ